MSCNQSLPSTKKLVQVSEQMATPVQVPIVLGNECYVLTQQDFRKIEDTRVMSYSRILADGRLVPVDFNANDSSITDSIINAANTQANLKCALNCNMEALMRICCSNNNVESYPTPPLPREMATIQEQMDWSNNCTTDSKSFTFTYGKSTSTTELNCSKTRPKLICIECIGQEEKHVICRGINTDLNDVDIQQNSEELNAMQKLKQQKINTYVLD